VFGAALLGAIVGTTPVFGHADYERSEPARDAVVAAPPERVDVWFTQDLFKQTGANFVRVFNEQGSQVSGDGVVDDDDRRHIFAELPQGLASGRYVVQWMTTSDEDGEADEGAFCFYVGVEATAEQETECASFASEEEPTETSAPRATATAAPTSGTTESDDGGGATVAIVVGVIVGVAALAVVVGGGAAWLRRGRR